MNVVDTASKYAFEWRIGNHDGVIRMLRKMSSLEAAAITARMVLLLHNGHELTTDTCLAQFMSRLEIEVRANKASLLSRI